MSYKDIAIIELIAVFVANSVFTFRFQRTTLGICRVLLGQNDVRVQAAMSPVWIGFLGWTHSALIVVVTFLLWSIYGWPFGIAVLIYSFLGLALLNRVSPLPTYRFCFRLIESELDKRIREDASGEFFRLKEQVLAVRSKFGV